MYVSQGHLKLMMDHVLLVGLKWHIIMANVTVFLIIICLVMEIVLNVCCLLMELLARRIYIDLFISSILFYYLLIVYKDIY